MKPEIITFEDRKLIGMKIHTTMANDQTVALWQKFMPRRHEILNKLNNSYFSVQAYDPELTMHNFTEHTVLEKWAAIEVESFNSIPNDMEKRVLTGGKYAVFIHKGPVATFQQTMQYILGVWLPDSEFQLDKRDIFEILGEKYLGPTHPDSEEEVWIPII